MQDVWNLAYDTSKLVGVFIKFSEQSIGRTLIIIGVMNDEYTIAKFLLLPAQNLVHFLALSALTSSYGHWRSSAVIKIKALFQS